MNKKQKIMRTCGCLMMAGAIACYSLGGAYAYQSNELRVTNTIETGDVDIAISETQLADDGVTIEPFVNDQVVVPGDTISKIVSVKNLAADCYIRIKVQYNQPMGSEPVENPDLDQEETDDKTESIPEGTILEVSAGSYIIGEDITAGIYEFIPDQNVEYAVSSYYLSDVYAKEVLETALAECFADETVSKDDKDVIQKMIIDLYEELGICQNAKEMNESIKRSLYDLQETVPSEYTDCLSGLNFEKEETTSYLSEGTVSLQNGQMLTVKDGDILKMILKSEMTDHLYELTDLCLNGISDQWIKAADGYYYYKDIVPTGETVQFFESVSFPTEWTEEIAGFTCGLEVTSEAVQAANFYPDFEGDSPWGDTEIEVCIHENDGTIKSKEQNHTTMAVSLDATTAQLVTDAKDFFANFDEFMPGDTMSDTLHIENKNSHEAEIFFHTETPDDLTEEQQDLLKNLQLTISVNGKNIYTGDLESTELNKKISLGVYKKGGTGTVDFKIHMPEEDKNIYALRDTKITWVFDCGWTEEYDAPKTGIYDDLVRNMIIAGTLFLAGGIMLIVVSKKKEYKQYFL